MNYLNSKTFCASAWFSTRNDNTEQLAPCCVIDCSKSKFKGKVEHTLNDTFETWHNSDYLPYLRKELDSGEFPEECVKCRQDEKHNLRSLRQSSNKTIANNSASQQINDSWMTAFFHDKHDLTSDVVVSMDAMISNFCNFECVMCNSLDSSKIKSRWAKNATHPSLQNTLNSNPLYLHNTIPLIKNSNSIANFQSIVNNHPISFLHIRGGEPLIDKHVLSILESLPENKKKKIRLLFNSNCSVDLTTTLQQLSGFKDMIIIASLDAVGIYAEYVRKHSVWTEIEASILNAIKNTDVIIKVHCTVHALNVAWLYQLEEWCELHNLEITFSFVYNPDYLSLASVPTEVLQVASSKIKNKGVRDIIAEYEFSEKLHEDLLTYVDFYDESSEVKFNDLLNKKGTEVPLLF
jgi:hypothetical protein